MKTILSRTLAAALARLVKITSKFWLVLVVYFVSRFAAATVMSWLEGWSFPDSFWWTGVASLTIGYGDFFPKTTAGKLVADGFQLFWVVYITPAVIAHMVGFVIKNLHLFTHREQEWLFTAVTRCYELLRFCAQELVGQRQPGLLLQLDVPFVKNGLIQPLPPQPKDLEDEELIDEFDEHDAGMQSAT